MTSFLYANLIVFFFSWFLQPHPSYIPHIQSIVTIQTPSLPSNYSSNAFLSRPTTCCIVIWMFQSAQFALHSTWHSAALFTLQSGNSTAHSIFLTSLHSFTGSWNPPIPSLNQHLFLAEATGHRRFPLWPVLSGKDTLPRLLNTEDPLVSSPAW